MLRDDIQVSISKKPSEDPNPISNLEMERFKKNLQDMINHSSSGRIGFNQIVPQKFLNPGINTSKGSGKGKQPGGPFLHAKAKVRNSYLERQCPDDELDVQNLKRREKIGISADAMKDKIIAEHKHNTLS